MPETNENTRSRKTFPEFVEGGVDQMRREAGEGFCPGKADAMLLKTLREFMVARANLQANPDPITVSRFYAHLALVGAACQFTAEITFGKEGF